MIAIVATDTAGTEWDLRALYEAEYTRLVRLASLLVRDVRVCEELVQDAFVKASLHRIDDPARAAAYVRSCVLNGARSTLRRERVAARFRSERPREARAAESEALAASDRDAVVEALRRLPRRQRECLVLRYYEDLREDEIAAVLGISRGSVKTHCHRGMAALAQHLGES